MKAEEAKITLLRYVLHRLHHVGAATEYGADGVGGIADVFSFTESMFSYEFEVKVAKGDLLGELKTVELLLEEHSLFREGKKNYLDEINTFAKLDKHCQYLHRVPPGEEMGYRMFGPKERDLTSIPNKFSFAVPEHLAELALEKLKDSPYGLFVIGEGFWDVECKKRAEWLHREKITEKHFHRMIRKCSVEIAKVRHQLYETRKSLPPTR